METDLPVAIKWISKKFASTYCLTREDLIFNKLEKHPSNIIKLYETFETDEKWYLVLELGRESLLDRIAKRGRYSEHNAKQVMKQLFSAIKDFHSVGLVHGDLKIESVLLVNQNDDINIKVNRFTLSRVDPSYYTLSNWYQPCYHVAPEILESSGYDRQTDMWSAGVILYQLLCGYPPFDGDTDVELFEKIFQCNYTFCSLHWDKISSEAKDLIAHLIVVDPKKRLTLTQAMQHAWFCKDSFDWPTSHLYLSDSLQQIIEELFLCLKSSYPCVHYDVVKLLAQTIILDHLYYEVHT